jgi:hypothetical protein
VVERAAAASGYGSGRTGGGGCHIDKMADGRRGGGGGDYERFFIYFLKSFCKNIRRFEILHF